MAKVNAALRFFIFIVCLEFYYFPVDARNRKQGTTWCVARPEISSEKLQGFLDFACSKYNCAEIQPGGSCYEPNTVLAHASYAIDLHYRNTGDCPSDIALPAITDPSWGTCHYP